MKKPIQKIKMLHHVPEYPWERQMVHTAGQWQYFITSLRAQPLHTGQSLFQIKSKRRRVINPQLQPFIAGSTPLNKMMEVNSSSLCCVLIAT